MMEERRIEVPSGTVALHAFDVSRWPSKFSHCQRSTMQTGQGGLGSLECNKTRDRIGKNSPS